jgi:hypothetical protein
MAVALDSLLEAGALADLLSVLPCRSAAINYCTAVLYRAVSNDAGRACYLLETCEESSPSSSSRFTGPHPSTRHARAEA